MYYTPRIKLTLNEGEQYFLTLLHEIGHFIMWQTPKVIVKRKRSETERGFKRRYREAKNHLVCDIVNHKAIETWARRQFKKQRKKIEEILKYDKG